MNMLMRALSAEALKLRGTLALWMSLIAPAAVVGLVVLQVLAMDLSKAKVNPPEQAWENFIMMVVSLWALLMMPLFITLQSALIAGLEHSNQQWKHLLSLPVPKGVHYLAKLIALMGLVMLALAVLGLLLPLGGWVLAEFKPQAHIAGPVPWDTLARLIPACFAAGVLMMAIHTWVSTRWRSFTVAVSFGMVATVAGFLIMQSQEYGKFYPWSMPMQLVAGDGENLRFAVVASLSGGLLVALAGLWGFVRREDI